MEKGNTPTYIINKKKGNVFLFFNGLSNSDCGIQIENFYEIPDTKEKLDLEKLLSILCLSVPLTINFPSESIHHNIGPYYLLADLEKKYPNYQFFEKNASTRNLSFEGPLVTFFRSREYVLFAKPPKKLKFEFTIPEPKTLITPTTEIDISLLKNVEELSIKLAENFGVDHVAIKIEGNLLLDPKIPLEILKSKNSNDVIQVEPRKVFVRYGKKNPIEVDVSNCLTVASFIKEIKIEYPDLKDKEFKLQFNGNDLDSKMNLIDVLSKMIKEDEVQIVM